MRQRFLSLVLAAAIVTGLAACASPTAQTDAPIHPLDPLSAEEITAATAVLNAAGQMAPSVRVVILETEEPEKARVLEQAAKGQSRRVARALLYDWKDGALTESRVDLQSRTVASTRALGTGDPPVRHVILSRATEIAVADPRVAQALKRRGVPLDRVTFLGGLREGGTLPQRGTARLVTVSPYVWAEVGDAAILPGFSVRVDLTAGVVDAIQEGPIPGVPAASARPPGASASSTLKPLRVTSPDGPSFRIRGSEIEWDRWRIHYGVHPRRGIEVFDVGWRDGDRYRSVLYRGSLSELITPYGDPSFGTWYPRDAGDYGMTSYSASRAQAIIGADAPDNAVFRPAAIAGTRGQAITIERAVAIYERDAGVLWRHAGEGQRARQLVLSGYSTVDNYDYLFHWIFGQDGAIDVQVQLTGVMNVRPIPTPGEPGRLQFGHMVAPGINAPNHEHFFSWRLDLDVDGNANRVVEMNTAHVPDNVGEWFAMEERILRSEMEGQRDMEFSAARRWLVRNNSRTNALDHPVAYALIPGENAPPFQAPGSAPRRRAPFLDHQLWITRYDRAQMYSSGEFVNLDTSKDNVAAWSGDNQSLMDEDVVLWYTLAVLHLPRPEDWPVMPSHTAGFRLVPAGFFAANPAYDANASSGSTGVRPAVR